MNMPLKIVVHPAADIFPMMDDAAFEALKDDIDKHGQREPVVFHNGKLIDGRNRLRACNELGIEASDCELESDIDPIAFVLSANLHRRHLTTSQRAMAAAKLSGLPVGSNQYAKGEGTQICVPMTVDAAAKLFNVSERSVTTALEVLREASPVVAEQVQRGDLAVSRAVKLLKAVPDKRKQTTIANKGKDAIADALGENEPLEITEAVKRLRDRVFSTIERYPKHGLQWAPDHLRQVADEIDVGVKNGHFPESAAVASKATSPESSSILKPEDIKKARFGPRELKDPRSKEYAIQTLFALKTYVQSKVADEARITRELDVIRKYRHWEVLGYESENAMLEAEGIGKATSPEPTPKPSPEPRPCMFTDKMKDDLEQLFGALDNARRWAMHESIFDTAEWKSNGQEIRTKIRAVWSAFSDLQEAARESGIWGDEESAP